MFRFAVLPLVLSVAAAQLMHIPLIRPTGFVDRNLDRTVDLQTTGPFQPVDPQRQQKWRPAPQANDVDMVIVGLVSGNRNPDIFLQNDPNQGRWGDEGITQLNKIGKLEALNLGRSLRERYGQKLLTTNFYPTNFMSFSSTGESEQMTAQTVNTGTFPPTGKSVIDPSIMWQPVPVTTDDTLLGISRVIRCPKAKEVLEPIFNGDVPVIRQAMDRETDVIDYIVKSTGVRRNVEDLSEVAENLHQLQKQNLPFPDWAENPTLTGMNKRTLYWKTQIWRNAIEVACAVHQPCRRLFSGVVLNQMKEIIESVTQKQQQIINNVNQGQTMKNQLGMVVYTGDVETILSVFRVLGLDYFNIPTTGGFILEVRVPRNNRVTFNRRQNLNTNTPTIRVLYHQPCGQNNRNTNNKQCFYLAECVTKSGQGLCNCPDNFCPMQTFIGTIQPWEIKDVQVACGNNENCNLNMRHPTLNNVNDMINPKVILKTVDCAYESDKYPEAACQQLAKTDFCTWNMFVRNVVCRRTCNCNQLDSYNMNDINRMN